MIDIEVLENDEPIEVNVSDVIQTGGSGGTTNYNLLTNKPQIGGVVLQGNKSLADLGITSAIASEVEEYVEDHKEELKGEDGAPGADGYTPQKNIDYFDGEDGEDGFSPSLVIEQTATGAVIYATDKDGTTSATILNGQNGQNGVDGHDYVITEADYNEIATIVYDMFTDAESVEV